MEHNCWTTTPPADWWARSSAGDLSTFIFFFTQISPHNADVEWHRQKPKTIEFGWNAALFHYIPSKYVTIFLVKKQKCSLFPIPRLLCPYTCIYLLIYTKNFYTHFKLKVKLFNCK